MEQKKKLELRIFSSLEKIFPEKKAPVYRPECCLLTALRGERVSFQVGFAPNVTERQEKDDRHYFARVEVDSALAEYVTVREVVSVPNRYPCHLTYDDDYLRTEPGLYPDLLQELRGDCVVVNPARWGALWVDVYPDEQAPAGDFPVRIIFRDAQTGELLGEAVQTVTVCDALLPAQTLIRTEWFHADCLADYYHVPVFSEEHWRILENFIRCAAEHGINMLLTPVFTPPLDTKVGGERTTVQLVKVYGKQDEKGKTHWCFDFSLLERWVKMCLSCGIRYFEISHLFTQWGAKSAPKVMAEMDGEKKRVFGWDTPAVGGAYTEFLRAFLPQLLEALERLGVRQNSYFHISDEPAGEHLESYRAARESVADLLEGQVIMDALSNYEFYEKGYVTQPICSSDHIQTFLDQGVKHVWSYYCTAQSLEVSNRFLSMPSARNRAYGLQLFKFDIPGCLHWGFNFYNSMYSLWHVDPMADTCAGGMVPGGDPFLVYPGEDGRPMGSIRLMVFEEGLNDLRALQLLAELIGKEETVAMLEEELSEGITFSRYPRSDYYYISVRNRVNRRIARELEKRTAGD